MVFGEKVVASLNSNSELVPWCSTFIPETLVNALALTRSLLSMFLKTDPIPNQLLDNLTDIVMSCPLNIQYLQSTYNITW